MAHVAEPNGEKTQVSSEIVEELFSRTVDLDSLFNSLGAQPGTIIGSIENSSCYIDFGPTDGVEDALDALKSHIHTDES
ncbi:MAG: hypothetical protein OEY85_15370 [Rhodospirillales bacterium]|nr:hypothetical protein [Rhodospirillales bacterium]